MIGTIFNTIVNFAGLAGFLLVVVLLLLYTFQNKLLYMPGILLVVTSNREPT
jgi:hypothetical protein